MPLDSMNPNAATSPSNMFGFKNATDNTNTYPAPDAPYVELLAVDVASYAEVNAEFAKVNVLIQWLRDAGAVKNSADQ